MAISIASELLMKLVLLLFIFSINQVYAYCGANWTHEAVLLQVINQENRLSSKDKRMIHAAVSWQNSLQAIDEPAALEEFFQPYAGGEIQFYSSRGSRYAILSYWPGGNRYGAIVEVARNFTVTGHIQDGEVHCLF
jgi:hypothetical protein